MRILITNDDGITSPVLPLLATWAQIHGDVTIVAPKEEQSAKSQAIDIRNEIEIKRVDIGVDAPTYAMASTPADCVRFGVLGLGKSFNLVLSGINRGYNVGHDIAYSGTVGAIFEGDRLGIPGIALSTDPDNLISSVKYLDTVFDFFTEHRLMEEHCLYNVNFPPLVKGIRMTRQGGMFFSDNFAHRGGDMYIQVGEPIRDAGNDLSVDIAAVRANLISISPLTACKTAVEVFDRLKNISQ